ncbi:MAG: tetratricopeptide repeat protein [Sedimentisphaerales bacterium]|nr:tetratricopeptide repeat protein [Sedimentisphaerales bacterium]
MKSEHRHELKTNELAEWLGNLPEWTKENIMTIIVVLVVIAAAVVFLIMRNTRRSNLMDEQVNFTALVGGTSAAKMQIYYGQSQGTDNSYYLLTHANNLKDFAESTKHKNMAAVALIEGAEAIRSELHYRLDSITKEKLIEQIESAKACYTEALAKADSNSSLIAAAKYGLGLCAEELGDFAEARRIYQEIVSDTNLEGTVPIVQAKRRLDIMSDYENDIVFKPAPVKEPEVASTPTIQIRPTDANLPVDANLTVEANLPIDVNVVPQIPEMNQVPILSDEASEDSDVNVPVE